MVQNSAYFFICANRIFIITILKWLDDAIKLYHADTFFKIKK